MRIVERANQPWLWALGIVAMTGIPSSRPPAAPPPPPPPPPSLPPELLAPPTVMDLEGYLSHLRASDMKYDVALPRATIATSLGTIHCTLLPNLAPRAVANFIGLASGQQAWRDPRSGQIRAEPFYDGLTFHRVIPGFVIQGGDPLGTGAGGPGYTFDDEIDPAFEFVPGTLAMANRGPNTNGSQFFITDGSPSHLRGHETVIGMCTDLDVIHRIASVPTVGMDRPRTPITIEHVDVRKY